MSTIQVPQKLDPTQIGRMLISSSSAGQGATSKFVREQLKRLSEPSPTFGYIDHRSAKSIEEKLYDALAHFKIRTSQVAMHLDREWRGRFFSQLDSLLSVDDWEREDLPPTAASFATLLRMIVLLHPERRPGLGATSDGRFIAAWTNDGDRLTIECFPKDVVRWNLVATIDGERERAAAEVPVARLAQVLAPYDPSRWFKYAERIPPQ